MFGLFLLLQFGLMRDCLKYSIPGEWERGVRLIILRGKLQIYREISRTISLYSSHSCSCRREAQCICCVSLSSLICTRKYWLTCVLAYFPRIRRSTGFLKLLCINLIFTLSKMPRNSLDKQHVVSQAFRYHIAGIPPR